MLRELPQKESSLSPEGGGFLDEALFKAPFSTDALKNIISKIPLQRDVVFPAKIPGIHIDVLRTDLIDPQISGNKLFKLWGHLHAFDRSNAQNSILASFGGAYSNHLHALAAAGRRLSYPTIGFIRGEQPKKPSATLSDLQNMGMTLVFLDRASYRRKHEPAFQQDLEQRYLAERSVYWLPEGGGGERGLAGVATLGQFIAGKNYSHVVHACGTGTTLAGLISGFSSFSCSSENVVVPKLLGISALRANRSIIDNVIHLLRTVGCRTKRISWSVSNQYHHGGFAKLSADLSAFMDKFNEETAIPSDRVYTGKVFYAVAKMLADGCFAGGSRILVVHSGGLQGNR